MYLSEIQSLLLRLRWWPVEPDAKPAGLKTREPDQDEQVCLWAELFGQSQQLLFVPEPIGVRNIA